MRKALREDTSDACPRQTETGKRNGYYLLTGHDELNVLRKNIAMLVTTHLSSITEQIGSSH